MKHLLKLQDLTTEEITKLLDIADKLKSERKKGIKRRLLEGKTLGMIFTKSSTRTRVSFEVGMMELGGIPIVLTAHDTQIGRGEDTRDTARVLSRYLDALMIRTFEQEELETFASYGTLPIINALTDYAHPCQVLADLMTIREVFGTLEGITVAYMGDGNNMANSIIVGCLKMGMNVQIATPSNFMPDPAVMAFASEFGDKFKHTTNITEALKDAQVVFTDVWVSMGQEKDTAARQCAFEDYCLTSELMKNCAEGAIVLHCLPAHRGEEITEEVLDQFSDVIFEEAENRLHAQKAVLCTVMGVADQV